MPRVQRRASVVWEGNVARGTGRISAGTGAFSELPYSAATRIGAPEGKTSPEELLAAAHAGCFAMSLAGELAEAGGPPDRLDVTATVTLDEVEGLGHRVVASDLEARAIMSGIDETTFQRAVQAADQGCPFSALVKASATVKIEARIQGGS